MRQRQRPGRRLDRPVFIIGCNRSGTTALHRNLAAHPSIWSCYGEQTETYRDLFSAESNRGDHVEPPVHESAAEALTKRLYEDAHNKQILLPLPPKLVQRPFRHLLRAPPIRLVEKTPENCFRVELLNALYGDALFLYVVRDGRAVVSSLIEGWKQWGSLDNPTTWHYLRPPGWLELRKHSLARICFEQWKRSNEFAIGGLTAIDPDRVFCVWYRDLYYGDTDVYEDIRRFCELPASEYWWERIVDRVDERVYTTGGSEPEREKWKRKNGRAIRQFESAIAQVHQGIEKFQARGGETNREEGRKISEAEPL